MKALCNQLNSPQKQIGMQTKPRHIHHNMPNNNTTTKQRNGKSIQNGSYTFKDQPSSRPLAGEVANSNAGGWWEY